MALAVSRSGLRPVSIAASVFPEPTFFSSKYLMHLAITRVYFRGDFLKAVK